MLVFDTLILRDIRQKYNIKNTALMDRISQFLMDNVSNLTSARSISDTLTSNSDIGNIKENIGISLKGNDLTIAFNSRYFTECLRTITDEAIKINFNMPSSPCIITPSDGDEYLYLVLPVRIINQ